MPEPSKILLVEDDPHLAKGLRFNLEREGYEVFLVDNGVSALDLLKKKNFDLIVLDLMLPKIGGLEVARTIRETNVRFPILMLTAKSSKKDREIGLEAGADDIWLNLFIFQNFSYVLKVFCVDQNGTKNQCMIKKFSALEKCGLILEPVRRKV